MYKLIYYFFIVGILWAPLFTIFYLQFGSHQELDEVIRKIETKTFIKKIFSIFLIGVFGIRERWATSISFFIVFFIFKVIGIF